MARLGAAAWMSRAAEQAVLDAVAAVVSVRCHGFDAAAADLSYAARVDPIRFVSMTTALAAMVPAEKPCAELLAWTDELQPPD